MGVPLKIASRTLIKNKGYLLVNVLGLGVALSCCIVAYINYADYARFDEVYASATNVYRINSIREVEAETQNWGVTPLALAPAAAERIPGIERYARLQEIGVSIRRGDRLHGQGVFFADPAFVEMLDFRVLSGNIETLADPNTIILTEWAADWYFGDEDPIGQTLELLFVREQETVAAKVGAVLEETPRNSSFRFGFLMDYAVLMRITGWENGDWSPWQQPVTLVQLGDRVSPDVVEEGLQQFVEPQNQARPNWMVSRYFLQPLPEIGHSSDEFVETALNGPPPVEGILIMVGLAGLILLIACFNFTNTTIAMSGGRLREIAYKKVVGAGRGQLTRQFLFESLLVCVPALVVGLVVAYFLGRALMQQGMSIEPDVSLLFDLETWAFLAAILFGTGILAGFYPALYISKFQPAEIFGGRSKFRGTNVLTRLLLGAQITASILAIIIGITFSQNARYQEKLPLGFNANGIIIMPLFNPSVLDRFGPVARAASGVRSVAGTGSQVGMFAYRALFSEDREGAHEHEVHVVDVGPDYIETMEMEIVSGRSFDAARPTDLEAAVINETLMEEMGWNPSSALGQPVVSDGRPFSVIGVVKDFKQFGMRQAVPPISMHLVPPDRMYAMSIRAEADQLQSVRDHLEEEWYKLFPDMPFYAGFMEEAVLWRDRQTNDRMSRSFLFLALIATGLSAFGLFSLVSLRVTARRKEIGVRKVLGASVGSLVGLVNREVVHILLLSLVAGSMAGYLISGKMLDEMFAFRMSLGPTPALIAALTITVATSVTIGYQVYKAATSDPVDSIRTE